MNRIFSLMACTFFSLGLFGASATQTQSGPFASGTADPIGLLPKKKAKLTAGTIVFFETTSSFNSRESSVGDVVPFRVTTNVKAERETVIKTGTQALGRITKITKATFNSPEVIQIEVKYVQAVDGTQVTLSTNPIRIKGDFPGQGVEVDAYTAVTSMVMDDVEISLK